MKKSHALLEKVLKEAKKIKDLDSLKSEIKKVTDEIKVMSQPLNVKAQEKLKELEEKYSTVLATASIVQKSLDGEMRKAVEKINQVRGEAEKTLKIYQRKAIAKKEEIKKMIRKEIAEQILKEKKLSNRSKTPNRRVKKATSVLRAAKKHSKRKATTTTK